MTRPQDTTPANPAQGAEGQPCEDCGRPSLVWFAPNRLWNRVKGGPDATDDPGGHLCPYCFIVRAEAAGVKPTAWMIAEEILPAAAIGAGPKPPGWSDPLESPQAEAIRNGKLDDTEIRNLFDCMERELRLHRERAANPAQGVRDEMVETVLKIFNSGFVTEKNDTDRGYTTFYRPKSAMRAALAAIGAGGQAVAAVELGGKAIRGSQIATETQGLLRDPLQNYVTIEDAFSALSALAHPVQPGWVALPIDEAAALCKRLEHDASWDKCGHGYYRLKRALPAAPKGE